MRFLYGAAFFVMLSTRVWAQTPMPAEINLPSVDWPAAVTVVDAREHNVADKKFWTVATALNVAMVLDTKSTFDVTRRCPTCVEANPYAAPFINRGPAVAFTAGEAFDAGVMVLAAKMRSSDRPQLRKIWWLIPVALTTGHVVAWQHNLRVR